MRKLGKLVILVFALVLAMSMGISALAETNYKTDILTKMDAAAAEIGVTNSVKYKNARASVANYTGTITKEQYEAALVNINDVKNYIINNGGAEAVAADPTKMNTAIGMVQSAAAAVGITVIYDGNGAGHVAAAGNPIKQTGISYASTMIMIAAAVAVMISCVAFSRKRSFNA